MKKQFTIAVLDDDPAVRAVLAHILERHFSVKTAASGAQLRRLALREPVDLFIVDIRLKNENGVAIGRRLRRISAAPMVFLSGDSTDKTVIEALNLPHSDYLAKPFHPDILLARLRNALAAHGPRPAGSGAAPPPGAGRFALDPRILGDRAPAAIGLTDVESRLLSGLSRALPGAISRRELSQTTFGIDWGPSSRRIDVHISHLRRKLAQAPGVSARIVSVRGFGYRLDLGKK